MFVSRSRPFAEVAHFFQTFAWDGFKQRLPKLLERGIGQAGEFELNLGKRIANI